MLINSRYDGWKLIPLSEYLLTLNDIKIGDEFQFNNIKIVII